MTADQEEILNVLLQGMQSPRPYFWIAMTAALSYEDTGLNREERGHVKCWSMSRVMTDYKRVKICGGV